MRDVRGTPSGPGPAADQQPSQALVESALMWPAPSGAAAIAEVARIGPDAPRLASFTAGLMGAQRQRVLEQVMRLFGVAVTREVVAQLGARQLDADAPIAVAEQGTAGPGEALPHGDRIQAAFGHHDVSGVNAHVG